MDEHRIYDGSGGMILPSILIETYAHVPHSRTYHVRHPLTEVGSQCVRHLDGFGVGESSLLDMVLAFPGVESVALTRYQISVRKAPLFSWYELEPRIMEVLNCWGEGIKHDVEVQ